MIITDLHGGCSETARDKILRIFFICQLNLKKKFNIGQKTMSGYKPSILQHAFARGRALEHVLTTVNSPGKVGNLMPWCHWWVGNSKFIVLPAAITRGASYGFIPLSFDQRE